VEEDSDEDYGTDGDEHVHDPALAAEPLVPHLDTTAYLNTAAYPMFLH
jgi:hypothetical protein